MNEHVVVDFLVRVRRVVHEYEVTRIARHKQVTHAVDRTLVKAPAHIASVIGSRKRQVIKIFLEEVLAQVNEGYNLGLHLATFLVRPNLHNTRTAEHENRFGIRVVRTTVCTFKRVDKDCRTELGNHGIVNFATDRILIRRSHLGPGRIGDVAEIGSRPIRFLLVVATGVSRVGIRLAATAQIVGIRKEGIAVLIPYKRSQFVVLHAVCTFRNKFHPVALVREVPCSNVVRINFGREPVEVAGNARRPEPFLIRVHHQVPKALGTCRRGRCLHEALATVGSFLFCSLANLVDVRALGRYEQVAIRMVHDAIGSFHPVFLTAKRILLQQL